MDDRVEPSEKAFIREYRGKHGISDDLHRCVSVCLGVLYDVPHKDPEPRSIDRSSAVCVTVSNDVADDLHR